MHWPQQRPDASNLPRSTQSFRAETKPSTSPLYTFDDNGLGCAIGELIDGEDWVVAGAVCNNGNELKLYANP